MSYNRAEEILPLEIVELIQQYVDGESIYIPRKAGSRQKWGNGTGYAQELKKRNQEIFMDYRNGQSELELAERYNLSEKSIQRILHEMKNGGANAEEDICGTQG